MLEPVDPAAHRGWSAMKMMALFGRLKQFNACIQRGTMCGCRDFSMLSLGDSSELTEA